MIDINDLRFSAANSVRDLALLPSEVLELLDRLEAAEKERDDLKAKIAEMEKQEPVAWQTRTRPAWNDGTWGPWRKCSKEYAEDIKKTPSLHDWLYEARALYTLPGSKGEEK